MNVASVRQHHVETDDSIQCQTPSTGAVAIASMSGMPSQADARASAMRKRSLCLIVDSLGEIPKPYTSADFRNVVGIESDALKAFKIHDHTPALSSQTERSISVSTSSRLHLNLAFRGTSHGI